MSLNICFIGAGNLATHLSKALFDSKNKIVQVYSRSELSAKTLADLYSAPFTTSPENINASADIYFVTLKDSAFEELLPKINFSNKLVVHCSGSLPLFVLEKYAVNFGVFYPLQTFSKNREVDFSEIPLFIEANSKANEDFLFHFAGQISNKVSVCSSEQRKAIHIAAVFACNFVNHLYTLASEILKSNDIPFDVLKPLILETARKVQEMNPEQAQTGPAVRFDENIIRAHLAELAEFDNYRELYKSISESIFEHHKKL